MSNDTTAVRAELFSWIAVPSNTFPPNWVFRRLPRNTGEECQLPMFVSPDTRSVSPVQHNHHKRKLWGNSTKLLSYQLHSTHVVCFWRLDGHEDTLWIVSAVMSGMIALFSLPLWENLYALLLLQRWTNSRFTFNTYEYEFCIEVESVCLAVHP